MAKKRKKKSTRKYIPFIIIGIIIILAIIAIIARMYRSTDNNLNHQDNIVLKFNYNNKEILVSESMINKEFSIYETLVSLTNPFMVTEYDMKQKINITKIEMLLLFYANDNNIAIENKELKEFLHNISYAIGEQDLKQALINKGITEDDFENYIRIKLIVKKSLEHMMKNINVTDKEIEEYYDQNEEMFVVPEIREIRHILVNTTEEAEDILEKLKHGEEFSELAKKYSIGPSASNGGMLGNITKGQFVPEFEEVAFNLTLGEISGPVKTKFGYHIIQVTNIEKERKISLEESKDFIRQILIQSKLQDRMENTIQELEEKYLIE